MLKRLLLITYYWPPSGGVAVLRWLEMTNYLAEQDWEITVVHPKNAAYTSIDNQSLQEINKKIKHIELPIIELGGLYSKISKSHQTNSSQVFTDNNVWWKELALKLRANFFIPDARMLWIKPTVKFLKQHLETNKYDIIISNGTPHSCHLIALALKQKDPTINWVADFRDPWLEIEYFDDLPLSQKALQKHKNLESKVLQSADIVTTVSDSWARLFEGKGAKQTEVFTNGYNAELIEEIKQSKKESNDFVISHVGTITEDRNPENLWKALEKENHHFKIKLVGPIVEKINQLNLINVEVISSTLPHREALRIMSNSNALLLLNNQTGATAGRIPAKIFEYLAFEKPIIYFGEIENDAAKILKESGMAKLYTYQHEIDLKELELWLQNPPQPIKGFAEQFSREKIANRLSDFLINKFEL